MFATVCTLGSLLMLVPSPAEGVEFPFVEKFDAGAAQRWQTFGGKWEFSEGFAKQTDTARNCGAIVKVKPTGPYWLAVRFRPDGDRTTGGLLFGLPPSDKPDGGMLIRCEPEDHIIWGRLNAEGRLRRMNEAIYDDDGDREQELAIAVDPAKGAFNLYHHGERIATNNRLDQATGYVGFACAGGPHTFLKFEVRPATAQELEGIKEPGPYSRIVDVVGDDLFIVALRRGPDLLTIYNDKGEPRESFKAADLPGLTGDDAKPAALTLASPGIMTRTEAVPPDLLVAVEGGASIYKLKNATKSIGSGPFYRNEKMQATAMAVGDGRIFIADAGLPGIRVLDKDGKELATFGEKGDLAAYDPANPKPGDKFKNPRGIAIAPTGEIVVTDRENFSFVVLRFDPAANKFTYAGSGTWIANPGQVFFDSRGKMIMAGLFEYYRSYGAVRVMDLHGISEKTWLAHSLRDMSDKVRACEGPGGKLYVVDPDKDRFMILPPDFVEPLPEFKYTDDGGVQLTMTKVDGSKVTSVSAPQDQTESGHPITVRQKEAVCETWPPATPADLTTYTLPPPPPKGKSYVIDMPVLVAVFKQSDEVRREGGEEKLNHVDIDTTGVIDRLKRELERARQFYWHVSHGTLDIQFDYMIVDDPDAKVDGGWIQPTSARDLVNKARAKAGLPPIDKDHSLIGIHPAKGFDPNYTDDPGIVGGGGLTPYAYSGYALWNNGQSWLFAHEWGHQLDSYFEKSGFPDWWLNHPDGTVHIGRYGEHWDCNAFLCRRADKMNWLRLKFGTIRAVADADGDGLADDDPTLPLDEKRFGSDVTKIDTDNDGLNDLAELCAGSFSSADPRNVDTNGNGIPDGTDPLPQFAVSSTIGANESSERTSRPPVGTIRNEWADATLRACYDSDTVIYTVTLQKPSLSVALGMDWNDDGWFVGQDNAYYGVELEWPKDGPAKVKAASNCQASLTIDGGKTTLEIVAKRPWPRPPLMAGSKIGICPRLGNGGGTIAFLLDPWELLELELK